MLFTIQSGIHTKEIEAVDYSNAAENFFYSCDVKSLADIISVFESSKDETTAQFFSTKVFLKQLPKLKLVG